MQAGALVIIFYSLSTLTNAILQGLGKLREPLIHCAIALVIHVIVLYAMLRCDSRRFWAALRNFVKLHMNEEFPVHAQEAYILYMDKAPEEKRMMLPVEKPVDERYKQFWAALESHAKPGMTIEQVGENMREAYGDTYWWYNIFGRKIPVISGNISHEVQS